MSLGPADLSFNRIAKIENLDALVNLTDLSLFNNRINTIAGLDACTKLQCLSLGNNLIDQVEQVCDCGARMMPSVRGAVVVEP
ncbi:hypothetical protein EON66_03325, partial [archaeon]